MLGKKVVAALGAMIGLVGVAASASAQDGDQAMTESANTVVLEIKSGLFVRPDGNCKDVYLDKRLVACFHHKTSKPGETCNIRLFRFDASGLRELFSDMTIPVGEQRTAWRYAVDVIETDKGWLGQQQSCVIQVSLAPR